MSDDNYLNKLEPLENALATGSSEAIRNAIMALNPEQRATLEARLGKDAVERLYKQARRVRHASKGRVIILHGIMGSMLKSTDTTGNERLIWVNPYHIFRGRIDHLKLKPDGSPFDSHIQVSLGGIMFEYLSLVVDLAAAWDVVPFSYDWRLDIDVAATQLNDKIDTWALGGPCHLVAHSMGGLVARRFIQLFPETWKSMRDPENKGRGGRLIMLGTPNKGSFSIPLALTGGDKYVRLLDKLDRQHAMPQVLDIVNTFIGSYQMLPSPKGAPGDDRIKLFKAGSWGESPVLQVLLDRGREFQENLESVVDPSRMVYVAGYGEPTPYRIKVDEPGVFVYQETLNGDGRVPHELGPLPGVPTCWVKAKHGDLQKNTAVQEGLHDLLATGTTDKLSRQIPQVRALPSSAFKKAEQLRKLPAEFDAILTRQKKRGKTAELEISPEDASRLASLMLEDDLGSVRLLHGAPQPDSIQSASVAPLKAAPPLDIQVIWGDITQVSADVYAVGSYDGVPPVNALWALDKCISGPATPPHRMVLTSLIRRGALSAALGDVKFFPWADANCRSRLVAVAGMGRPGTFGRAQLRQLTRNLISTIVALPGVREMATVVIGSGTGNLGLAVAVEDMLAGMIDALTSDDVRSSIKTIFLVEMHYARAEQVRSTLATLAERESVKKRIALTVPDSLAPAAGALLGRDFGLAMVGLAAAKAVQDASGAGQREALDRILEALPNRDFRDKAVDMLRAISLDGTRFEAQALKLTQRQASGSYDDQPFPTRVSFIWDGRNISCTALSDTAVIPERMVSTDKKLIDELVTNMVDPPEDKIPSLAKLLGRLIVPREFRETLRLAPSIVFEVDREMAKVHWEMLADAQNPDAEVQPFSLTRPVSRQLRTAYSQLPTADSRTGKLRVLIVGDPGDPDRGHSLPGARAEAIAMADMFKQRQDLIETVVAMIGAPGATREGELRNFPAASRLDVLGTLMEGGFDILHYCGHGDFDPVQTDMAGWLFKDGLLTSRELERVDLAPRLVLANACLSGLTSTRLDRGGTVSEQRSEVGLLPSLADEFFKRGVRQYIGTAWAVNDIGAVRFAEKFYDALLGKGNEPPKNVGDALLAARKALNDDAAKFGVLWAAYQHYGDPTFRLVDPAATET